MESYLKRVRDERHQFDKRTLLIENTVNPIDLFQDWLKDAMDHAAVEANAMSLSTLGLDGFPESRIVYFKEIFENGLVFYTNYSSDKGKAIAANPNVHSLFFWPETERQVSIKGIATKVPESMSDAYFHSRPKESKLGAWSSHQSEKLDSREELEKRLFAYSEEFKNDVPRPPHWGGYVIHPVSIEFWQGRPSRLHDRFVFEKQADGSWKIFRKNP